MDKKYYAQRGKNLKNYRRLVYKSASLAVKDFINHGCSIKYRRYLALEKGAYPSEQELRQISIMLGMQPHDWLFSHDPEIPNQCRELCDTFEGAPENIIKMLLEMVRSGVTKARELGIS